VLYNDDGIFIVKVKDYVSRAEQLKQLLKPQHDSGDGAPPPHDLGLCHRLFSCKIRGVVLFSSSSCLIRLFLAES